MKDFLGQDIMIGDTVVYPVRRGSQMEMRKSVVDSVDPWVSVRTVKGRIRKINRCDRVVVVTKQLVGGL